MIKLNFTYNRETLSFVIKEKEIWYTDKVWRNLVRCLPPPKDLMKTIALSRNRIPLVIVDMFKFTEEELKEYGNAKTEEELANIVIKDSKSKGCILHSKEVV